jgi:AraC family transcriptional regulator
MDARLEGDLRLDELAGEAGLSTSHFIRSFRENTGKTPYQFLLDRRIQKLKTLMRDPRSLPGKDCHVERFRRSTSLGSVFRRTTGMTPSAYRGSL